METTQLIGILLPSSLLIVWIGAKLLQGGGLKSAIKRFFKEIL